MLLLTTAAALSLLLPPLDPPTPPAAPHTAPPTSPGPAAPGAPTPSPDAPTFPTSWIGHWKGDATAGLGDKLQKFTMELIIAPTPDPTRHDWTLIYDGAAGRQERRYTLITQDAAAGAYAIDENNGIILDATLMHNVLHCHFEIQGNRITVREERVTTPGGAEQILIEMVTTLDAAATPTGGRDDAPQVRTWKPISIQCASLLKQPQDPKPTPTPTR